MPLRTITGNIQITSDYSGQTFIGGHPAPAITWTGNANGGNTEAFIFFESDGGLVSLFGGHATMPIMSTDTARLAVLSSTNSNDLEWFFSNTYFSIRLERNSRAINSAKKIRGHLSARTKRGVNTSIGV